MADHNLELQAKLEELQRELEVRLLSPSVCLGSTAGPRPCSPQTHLSHGLLCPS